MPLSPAADREPIHERRVECRGYRRRDGLWEIEASLVDVKSYPFANRWRGEIPPGEPLHHMWLRVTLDDDLVIRAIEASTDRSPYQICPDALPNYQRLVGLKIATGFTRAVRERVGGVEGCTHVSELFGPLATTAFQTIMPLRWKSAASKPDDGRAPSGLLGTCYAHDAARIGEDA